MAGADLLGFFERQYYAKISLGSCLIRQRACADAVSFILRGVIRRMRLSARKLRGLHVTKVLASRAQQ